MSIKEWIKKNKKELDAHIHSQLGHGEPLNNKDREEWMLNDEGLYNWARSDGVKL